MQSLRYEPARCGRVLVRHEDAKQRPKTAALDQSSDISLLRRAVVPEPAGCDLASEWRAIALDLILLMRSVNTSAWQ
jgi:hypothetical protein